jgi:hypothetical protein
LILLREFSEWCVADGEISTARRSGDIEASQRVCVEQLGGPMRAPKHRRRNPRQRQDGVAITDFGELSRGTTSMALRLLSNVWVG